MIKKITQWKKSIKNYKQKKGFTLIELIVVMAIIAILVLLAAPRFLGRTEDALATRIKNDITSAETKVDEYLIKHEGLDKWGTSITVGELNGVKEDGQLHNREGLIKTDDPDEVQDGNYKKIPDAFIDDTVKSNLNGDFYANEEGEVYYKAPIGSGSETVMDNYYPAPAVPEGYDIATDWNKIPDGSDADYPAWTDQALFTWTTADGSATITSYTGDLNVDLVIPETITDGGVDYPVTRLGGGKKTVKDGYYTVNVGMLYDGQVNSLHIPNTVEVISETAFYKGVATDGVYFGTNVHTIETWGLYFISGIDVVTPINLQTLESHAMPGNWDAEGDTNFDTGINRLNMYYSEKLTTIASNEGTLVNSYTFDNDIEFVFSGNPLNDGLILPASLEIIGYGAFSQSGVGEELVIPHGVREIGPHAFEWSEFKTFKLPNTVDYIGRYAFGFGSLESIEIPGSVNYLGSWAFSESRLSNLTLNEGLEFMGEGIADGTPIKAMNVPESVMYVDDWTFAVSDYVDGSYVYSLEQVNLGDINKAPRMIQPRFTNEIYYIDYTSVNEETDKVAFDALLKPYPEGTPIEMAIVTLETMYDDHPNNRVTFTQPFWIDSATETLKGYWHHGQSRDVVIPENVNGTSIKHIDSASFAKHRVNGKYTLAQQMDSLVIPSTVETIGDKAFMHEKNAIDYNVRGYYDSILQQYVYYDVPGEFPNGITIEGENLKTINTLAFSTIGALDLSLPDSVSSIGSFVIKDSDVKTINIPSGLTVIATNTFAESNLEAVDFSNADNLTSIEENAFQNANITTVTIPSSVTVHANAFDVGVTIIRN